MCFTYYVKRGADRGRARPAGISAPGEYAYLVSRALLGVLAMPLAASGLGVRGLIRAGFGEVPNLTHRLCMLVPRVHIPGRPCVPTS